MGSTSSYQEVTIPTLDAILSSLRSQSVPLPKMRALYDEVQYWETIRHTKLKEQAKQGVTK